jgi:FKBP-type peptidyl-prolyl cis-trans isomerase
LREEDDEVEVEGREAERHQQLSGCGSERTSRSRRDFFGLVCASTVATVACPGRSLAEEEEALVVEQEGEGAGLLQAVAVEQEEAVVEVVSGEGAATPSPSPSASTPSAVTVVGDEEKDSIILLTSADIEGLDEVDKKALKLNRQIQSQNRAPKDFPEFVRRNFDMLIFADGYKQLESGLIVKDFEEGQGETGKDGDEVTFHYTGFNEEGGFIDSSYKQRRPAQIRLGIGGMIPGFELALRDMKPGSRRIVIIPPALGPPVGPSTFFSAKQYEIFDIQLLGIKSCVRSSFGLVSTVKCE